MSNPDLTNKTTPAPLISKGPWASRPTSNPLGIYHEALPDLFEVLGNPTKEKFDELVAPLVELQRGQDHDTYMAIFTKELPAAISILGGSFNNEMLYGIAEKLFKGATPLQAAKSTQISQSQESMRRGGSQGNASDVAVQQERTEFKPFPW